MFNYSKKFIEMNNEDRESLIKSFDMYKNEFNKDTREKVTTLIVAIASLGAIYLGVEHNIMELVAIGGISEVISLMAGDNIIKKNSREECLYKISNLEEIGILDLKILYKDFKTYKKDVVKLDRLVKLGKEKRLSKKLNKLDKNQQDFAKTLIEEVKFSANNDVSILEKNNEVLSNLESNVDSLGA